MKSSLLPIGSEAPDFVVQTSSPAPVRLSHFRGQVVLVVFYRGHWCQSCRRQLAQLAAAYETVRSMNAELIAISADSPEATHGSETASGLPFPVVGDVSLRIIDDYGVRDRDDPEGRLLARPAVFMLDPAGIVRYCHIGAHRQDRPALGAIMLALESMIATYPVSPGAGR